MENTENISLLRIKQVMSRTGLPRSSIYAAIKAGKFPAGVKLSAQTTGWPSNLVDAWIASRIAGTAQ